MLSKACGYAINAMIYVASLPAKRQRARLRDIAKAINSPEAFTGKILQALVKDSLLVSTKGPNGGFAIKGSASQIMLGQIVSSIYGGALFSGCALGLRKCSENHPCAVHYKFKVIRERLSCMLLTTGLSDVAERVNTGLGFLKH
ncbi:transcriptional regulator, BadM/Rrf2 family [Lunatimonas lonarensis]|uniref:Transcriptional regulator, BadM/Rrf2 family n=1 Tax=Lunatimonas lonarensis TaxID=1232681 RepID=R7ZLH0_9BACT|nr:Rrf2 family transcriptional regulator [Lunatimonas lonarensis]EON74917.1 transcriptional regulator, BadM/Rrf2 family [Lunatimonas lonarensis]